MLRYDRRAPLRLPHTCLGSDLRTQVAHRTPMRLGFIGARGRFIDNQATQLPSPIRVGVDSGPKFSILSFMVSVFLVASWILRRDTLAGWLTG